MSDLFIALELTEIGATGFERLLYRTLKRPKIWLEEREARGVRFGVLHAQQLGDQPDWTRIAEVAGRLRGQILLPASPQPPPESGIAQPAFPRFERRVLLATACEIVRRTRMPVYRRVLGLIDPDGAFSDLLPDLLCHYSSVRVLTENLPLYERTADRMLEELGAPVLVGDSASILADAVLALAPGRAPARLERSFDRPVLAGSEFLLPFGCTCDQISQPQTELPFDLIPHLPPRILPHHFAGALHDLGNLEMESYVAQGMLYNGRRSSLAEMVGVIAQQAEASTMQKMQ